MPRISEAEGTPVAAPAYSEALSSGVQTGRVCSKIAVCVTATGNLSIRTLDGNAPTLTSLPVGLFIIDVQFDMATWTGTMTAVGFANV
jgi:hypothetical protein